MPFSAQKLPLGDEEDYERASHHALFEEHCLNVIGRLRNIRLVGSFSNDLDELSLKLENIKLRFVIWVRSTHSLKPKNELSVHELLTRLDLFLLHESEAIQSSGAYGMIADIESSHREFLTQETTTSSQLEKGFRSHADKYLAKRTIAMEIESIWNAWIVTDRVQYMGFLMILDSMVKDLFSNTLDDMTLALATGYVSTVVRTLKPNELIAVQESALASEDIVSRAAADQLSRNAASFDGMIKENSKPSSSESQPFPPATALVSYDDKPVYPHMVGSSNEVNDRLTVDERFAAIAEKFRESQETMLQQEYPISQLAQRRLMAELRQIDRKSSSFSIACLNNNLSDLLAMIRGPPDTPFENGIFFIKIGIPVNYPLEPAKFRFLTRIFHPNIDVSGNVCVKIADRLWSVTCSLEGLLASIISLLAAPYPEDPLLPAAAQQYTENRKLYNHTAKQWVKEYASKDWPAGISLSISNDSTISDDWVELNDFVSVKDESKDKR